MVIDGYLLTPSRTGALELGGELVVDIEPPSVVLFVPLAVPLDETGVDPVLDRARRNTEAPGCTGNGESVGDGMAVWQYSNSWPTSLFDSMLASQMLDRMWRPVLMLRGDQTFFIEASRDVLVVKPLPD